jgi:D-aminopeptidase
VLRKSPCVTFDEQRIDTIFAQVNQCHLPGAAVGIALHGRPVYRKGFGLASMELPVVLSPSTRMRIGSTTKHFTSLAYMLLCEQGKAHVDDPIGKYLPELHPIARRVTMRQLMGNISGLRDAYDIRWHLSGTERFASSEELLSLYRDLDDVNFAPGTSWSYCNGGYLLLSAAIERISGQSLEQVFHEKIFAPVGMHDTLLRRIDDDFVPNSASMHTTKPAGGFDRSYARTAMAGEGGIVSTVDDMLRWMAHMDAPAVGSAETWELMKTPNTLANGISTGYGLGLKSDLYRGIETLYHGGGLMGANSLMLKVPQAGLDIAIMVNRHDVHSLFLTNAILDACLPDLDPLKEAPSRPCVTGIFRSLKSGRVLQFLANNGQQLVSVDSTQMPFEPDAHDVLRPRGVFGSLKLEVTLLGRWEQPSAVQVSDYGNTDELLPVPPPGKADSSGITGRYRSDSTGIEATICDTAEGLRLHATGRFGPAQFRVDALAHGIWQMKCLGPMPWGGILSLDEDGARLRFSSSRTRALSFRRCR